MKKKTAIIWSIIIVLLVGLFTYGNYYVKDYYHATQTAAMSLLSDEEVKVVKTKGYYYFTSLDIEVEKEEKKGKSLVNANRNVSPSDIIYPKDAKKGPGVIFYPGGKVEETAYAPLMRELAKEGYEVYLVRMPLRLAVFKPDAASAIIEGNSDISQWTLMGHSLGGAMAANYASKNPKQVENLVLLAAYSANDLSTTDINVFLIYGSNDGVLAMDKYEKNKKNLPDSYHEFEIDGGNHGNFGYYGNQKGDQKATISRKEQMLSLLDYLTLYMD